MNLTSLKTVRVILTRLENFESYHKGKELQPIDASDPPASPVLVDGVSCTKSEKSAEAAALEVTEYRPPFSDFLSLNPTPTIKFDDSTTTKFEDLGDSLGKILDCSQLAPSGTNFLKKYNVFGKYKRSFK